MKVFLDANVLVSVLNKEYPLFPFSARVLSLSDNKKFQLFTSPLCLAIAWYFAEKKCGRKEATKKMSLLRAHLHISAVDNEVVSKVVRDKRVTDFEDGMEYYAALESGCKCIVTEDKDDFYFADVPVMDCRKFLEEYVF